MRRSRTEEPIDQAPAGWTDERKNQLIEMAGISPAQLDALIENLTLQKTTGPAKALNKSDWCDLTESVGKGLEQAIKALKPLVEAQKRVFEQAELFTSLPPEGSEADYTPEQEALVAAAHQFELSNLHYLELYRKLEYADGPLDWDEEPSRLLNLSTLYSMLLLAAKHARRENGFAQKTMQNRRRANSYWVYEVDLSLKSGFLSDIGCKDINVHSTTAQRIFSESDGYRFMVSASRTSPFYYVCLLCREVLDGPERDGPESAIRNYKQRLKRGRMMFPVPQ